jgi:hypothetical protein
MKRILSVLVLTLMVAATLVACSRDQAPYDQGSGNNRLIMPLNN